MGVERGSALFGMRPSRASADLAHLAIVRSNGMDAIVTHDAHFRGLTDSPVRIVSYRQN